MQKIKKLSIKISKSEFLAIIQYCENAEKYFVATPAQYRRITLQQLSDLYYELKVYEDRYDGKPSNYEPKTTIRVSEALALHKELQCIIPVNLYIELQSVLNKLDKEIINSNRNVDNDFDNKVNLNNIHHGAKNYLFG